MAGYVLHSLNIAPLPSLNHLADIGIQLLLFTVGLKIKPKSLIRREVLSVGGLHLLLMALISAICFLLLDKHITGGLVLGISLAFSSTVLAIKIFEDNRELSSLHGRDVLGILIFQDIVAVALLAVTEVKSPSPWALLLLGLPLLRPVAHRLLSISRASELKLLLGVSLALAGAVLAESVGISADIGALLTGITLTNHAKIEEVAEKLWSLKELFLVAFFLQIGLEDFPDTEQVYQALALLALLPVQGVMFFGLFIVAGMRARTAFISSLALMTYSEFALITTTAVVKAQLLPEEWKSVISLAVAGSLAIAALLNRAAERIFAWAEPLLVRFEHDSGHPDCLPESFDAAEWLIMGMGRTGEAAYQALSDQGQPVMGLDSDPVVLEQLSSTGRRVVYADVSDSELWHTLPLDRIKGVILTFPSFENRIHAIRQLRKNNFTGVIGTICYLVDDERLLTQHGASFVIHPLVEAGVQLANQMLVKNLHDMKQL